MRWKVEEVSKVGHKVLVFYDEEEGRVDFSGQSSAIGQIILYEDEDVKKWKKAIAYLNTLEE